MAGWPWFCISDVIDSDDTMYLRRNSAAQLTPLLMWVIHSTYCLASERRLGLIASCSFGWYRALSTNKDARRVSRAVPY
jgi:hypothetical protein